MLTPKPIHIESVPRALAKVERYRLLNEPSQAESICRDVIAIDPSNQQALINLILALSDMFALNQAKADDARPLLKRLTREFDRLYYAGVIEERWARCLMASGYPPSGVYYPLELAMDFFDKAQSHAEPGNDDAILRWNACLRFMQLHHIEADADDDQHASLDDDVPMR